MDIGLISFAVYIGVHNAKRYFLNLTYQTLQSKIGNIVRIVDK